MSRTGRQPAAAIADLLAAAHRALLLLEVLDRGDGETATTLRAAVAKAETATAPLQRSSRQ
jgi:hypothetical protein